MKPAFVQPTPLTKPSRLHSSAMCAPTRASTRPAATTTVTMVTEKKKEQSLLDWLHGKFMHNAMWEGDEEIGYETFWKEIETAREEEKKKMYDGIGKDE